MNNNKIFNKSFFIHYGDITDPLNISQLISSIKPDKVFNLAAQSHVKISFDVSYYTAQVDALGTLNILEACKNFKSDAKIYQASTSELYGGMGFNMPETGYNEQSLMYPRSPYGCAKIYGFTITRNYREAYNLHASNGILFNHESPRRGENFVTRKITKWIADYLYSISNNEPINVLRLGNLDAMRDWGHAKDYVVAMNLILDQKLPDDYVIATGETYSIRHFIKECFNIIGKTIEWDNSKGKDNEIGICDGQIVIKVDPNYYRPSEVEVLKGDATKAKSVLNWKSEYTFESLVEEMVIEDCKTKNISI